MPFEKAKQLSLDIEAAEIKDEASLEMFRIRYIGSKGAIKQLFSEIKDIPSEEKKKFGQTVNALKLVAEKKYTIHKEKFSAKTTTHFIGVQEDWSAPGYPIQIGTRHPISLVKDRIIHIFSRIGFSVSEGPEIEDDWHNFTALNTPKDHPARDMQDTFYISEDKNTLLRTHTSSTQIRTMEQEAPPIRIITPGRVYRNETISARAHCTFHQVEGLYIDEKVSFADLKQTIYYFAQEMFGKDTEIRLRPSYFPFTEPSAEMDISCFICQKKGCSVCKHSGWVEIGGCGMVDTAVLENAHIDKQKYTGFAFGMGVERIAMLKYQIDDIRLFFQNDIRFLEQFGSQFT